ncbi:hypothetical protein GCM10009863_51610 [Streptomyces axinellae]|uniref:HNH nuclease domain-containing protein n=2 Tax=Streptomyces axinellae TaxID=552788 RepID=A0ABP6CWB3_9ACTN
MSQQEDGCVRWTGYVSQLGYGAFSVNGQRVLAHRFVYELIVGPIPDGYHIDHLCHNRDESCEGGNECLHRRCVNPDHLEPVTVLENLRRSPHTPYGKPPKTACIHGHALTDDNVYVFRSGVRKCKRCTEEQQKERYRKAHPPKPERRFCGKGHEMTEENTYRYGNRRICRQCRRDADKAAYWRTRQVSE